MWCAQGVGTSFNATRRCSLFLMTLSHAGGSTSTLSRRSLILEQPSARRTPKSIQKSTPDLARSRPRKPNQNPIRTTVFSKRGLWPRSRARLWLSQLQDGTIASVEAIAGRERCSKRHVHMTISLAFLAPDLVTAAVERRLPDGIRIARLFDPPVEWDRQRRMLGLTSSSL